jgi:hypothetical protein
VDKRLETSVAFIKMVQDKGRSFSGKITTMDKSAVLIHTPETKLQSKKWLKRGIPSPIKAKVFASHTKQMVLAFFDYYRIILTNYIPQGATVNVDYIISALNKCFKAPHQKQCSCPHHPGSTAVPDQKSSPAASPPSLFS